VLTNALTLGQGLLQDVFLSYVSCSNFLYTWNRFASTVPAQMLQQFSTMYVLSMIAAPLIRFCVVAPLYLDLYTSSQRRCSALYALVLSAHSTSLVAREAAKETEAMFSPEDVHRRGRCARNTRNHRRRLRRIFFFMAAEEEKVSLGEDVADLLVGTDEAQAGIENRRCCGCCRTTGPRDVFESRMKWCRNMRAGYCALALWLLNPYAFSPAHSLPGLPSRHLFLLKLRLFATAFSFIFGFLDIMHSGTGVLHRPSLLLQLLTCVLSVYSLIASVRIVREPWPLERLGVLATCPFPREDLWRQWCAAAMDGFSWWKPPDVWTYMKSEHDLEVTPRISDPALRLT